MQKRIRSFKYAKGFTLVELIVVIGIISIMAIAVLAVLDPISQFYKANDARRKADLSQIQKALESYYQDKKRYPATTGSPNYQMQSIPWDSNWPPYMNLVPKDPNSSHKYVYYAPADGQSYYIYANLERGTKDPQICQNLNANGECSSVPAANLCGSKCNYGVSSPDLSP